MQHLVDGGQGAGGIGGAQLREHAFGAFPGEGSGLAEPAGGRRGGDDLAPRAVEAQGHPPRAAVDLQGDDGAGHLQPVALGQRAATRCGHRFAARAARQQRL